MMKLAVAQMVFGILVVVSHFLMFWALDGLSSLPFLWWEGPPFGLQFVLGILVFACGLAQYLKARR